MSKDGRGPQIEVFVHGDHELPHGFPIDKVEGIAGGAVEQAMAVAGDGAPLATLEEVEVTLVSDAVIADVHLEFMNVSGATDVITFDHGEILISTETAEVQGKENGNSIERETALYLVHGLLHLAGYADKSRDEFVEMERLQAGILDRLWPRS